MITSMAESQQWRSAILFATTISTILFTGSANAFKCAPGYMDCDNDKNCETYVTSDINNCGSCGVKCRQSPSFITTCNNGTCTYSNHTGVSNPCNLIDCRNYPGVHATCIKGTCYYECYMKGWANCNNNWEDGCETNIKGDINNCGSCGVKCRKFSDIKLICTNGICGYSSCTGVSTACINGKCTYTCPPKCANCKDNWQDGCETRIDVDIDNCGKCGAKCAQLPYLNSTCVDGTCIYNCLHKVYANCNNDWRDGCETYILGDDNNCGRCGVKCTTEYWNTYALCYRGKCAYNCKPGWAHCNEEQFHLDYPITHFGKNYCVYDLNNDGENCGACKNKCKPCKNGRPKCTKGKCECICDMGWANCNGSWEDGCETNTNTDIANCGSCGKRCNVAKPFMGMAKCSDGNCVLKCLTESTSTVCKNFTLPYP